MLQRAARVVIAILAGWSIASGADEDAVSNIEGSKDGVTVRVSCPKSFASNKDVKISYSMINRSESVYGVIYTNGYENLRIRLTGPDGSKVQGHLEKYEKNGWVVFGQYKRRYIQKLNPGEELEGDSVGLSNAWPLRTPGEYRCRMTKRIYRAVPPVGELLDINHPGVPLEIEIPEFTFHIDSIDPTFSPSWAPKPAVKSPLPVEDDEAVPAWRWVVCIGGLLTLASIFFAKREALQ